MERAAIWLSWDSPWRALLGISAASRNGGGAAFFLLSPLVPMVPLRGAYLGRTPFLGSSAKSLLPPPDYRTHTSRRDVGGGQRRTCLDNARKARVRVRKSVTV